jgi:gluconate 2-dehydrogenase alpha chain
MTDHGLLSLNPAEARTAAAVFERMFPTDERGPGAAEIGVLGYVDKGLAGAYADLREVYRTGLLALDAAARGRWAGTFSVGEAAAQDALLAELERGQVKGWHAPPQQAFFDMLRAHLQEGLFADPLHGGNRAKLGWKVLGHPGVWLESTAEENLAAEPVERGGVVLSLADVGYALGSPQSLREVPGYDPQRGAAPPAPKADVVLVGVGGVGGFIAPHLCRAGLKVVGLEAGPYWLPEDFAPDELGSTYYCRGEMGQKFLAEQPRWRPADGEPSGPITYSLGRMMNGVGGSVIHYGGWLRRFHPHHLAFRSHVRERWGEEVLPGGTTLVDWPIGYDELEPFFGEAERIAGVTREDNPFVPRSTEAPLPPLRPFRMGELFSTATRAMGYHPHMVAVGMTSESYHGLPATTYSAWNNGFGSWTGDKWHPGLTSVPEALATGNFDLRTHCRVTKVLTDGDGRARGVVYRDALGRERVQEADAVVLCAYTYENVRLMFLSADGKHPDGLGNSSGQLGKHYMAKMFAHVDGYVPDVIFNRHTGPAAQAVVMDDLLCPPFDPVAEGFVGGGTLGAENQFLPLQIARESLPERVPRWGAGYKRHLQEWQHLAVVRCQPDALPYADHRIEIDPEARDRSGLGMPVVRVTYGLKPNELRQADFFARKSAEILRAMGATETWAGPSFTGAASSHDLGGCRFGDEPDASVLDRSLRVHDTPGLYVFSGAAFPTCPGVNPTLTLWALCLHAAAGLVDRLRAGEER